jgi:hypothetical protein
LIHEGGGDKKCEGKVEEWMKKGEGWERRKEKGHISPPSLLNNTCRSVSLAKF